MQAVLYLMIVQALLGIFDIVYHHELTERITWRKSAALELKLHGVRNLLYAVIFLSLGWLAWNGALAWLFAAILIAEVGITLWDFVEEDRSRDLPPSERVTHALLAVNYGALIALLAPEIWHWAAEPTGLIWTDRGLLSWFMTLVTPGLVFWGLRDLNRARHVRAWTAPETPHLAGLPSAMSFLITGGTGFIGSRLAQMLVAAGHRVTIVTRDRRKAARLAGPLAIVDSVDLLEPGQRFDALINLAGEPVANGRWTAAKKMRILNSRLETTDALVRFIARAEHKPSVLISASAVGFYGTGGETLFEEGSHPRANFTHQLCASWEDRARQAEESSVRVCLMRFGLVLGRGGGMLGGMMPAFELGMGGPIGSGKQWMSWVHIDDAIGLILHAVAGPGLQGPINITAPQPVRNHDFARQLGRALRRPSLMPLPAFALRLLFGEMAEEMFLDGQRVVPKAAEASGYRFQFPDLKSALTAIVR
jgi:uncharacterized protein